MISTLLVWRLTNLAIEASYGICNVVAKRYDLYFGSFDHIGTKWCLRYLYYAIMFVGPLGDALSLGDLCSVYKARCCPSSGLGKK